MALASHGDSDRDPTVTVDSRPDHPAGDAEVVREVFEQLPMVVTAFTGSDHVYIAGNAACRAITGDRAFIGHPALEVWPEITGQQFREVFDRVYATGEPEHVREWRTQLDLDMSGTLTELFFDIAFSPLRDASGRVDGFTVILSDVTERVLERRRAEDQAAEAERRYQAARDVVAELQEALLPTTLPVLPAATIAARYLVAGHDQNAGGDWFDAVPLPDGTLGLVVGDIVGHGVTASAAMGQLRAVLNRALLETADLTQALGWADRMAAQSPVMRAATVCAAVLDPHSGALRYATCGHLSPLIVGPDGTTRYLPRSSGGPLGTSSPISTTTAELAPGEVMLLYSDGLVERPGQLLTDSLQKLAQVAGNTVTNRALPLNAPASAVERASQQCVEIMTRGGYNDDVTVLAVQRRPAVPPWRDERPARGDELARQRAALHGWLNGLGASQQDRQAIDLAVSELAANVIEHAYPDAATGTLRVRAELTPDGDVAVQVADDGVWRAPGPPAATSGRGLWMAGAAVDELTVLHPEDHARPADLAHTRGTIVTLRKALAHPAQLGSQVTTDASKGTAVEFTTELDEGPPRVVRVTGPIDITTAAQFADRLDIATRGGVHAVTLDLNDVDILASAGVRVLFELRDQLATHGNTLTLVAADNTPAQQVLDLVGLDRRSPGRE